MVLELMGVRLLGPHFGQSQVVWTNVIGVVLAAMALGQWLGGRWAESRSEVLPALGLFLAAAVAWALPNAVPWMSTLLLPDDLVLEEAAPFVARGSLIVALWGLGLPLVALGAVTPWLVRLSREAESRPGAVTGRLLGAGTVGSLLGTFGGTHLLLPEFGAAGALRCGAALLGLAGVLLVIASKSRPRAASSSLLVLIPLAAWALPTPPSEPGLLASVESFYQSARVVEDEHGARSLKLNEGLDSFHSYTIPGQLLTGQYYDAFLLPSLAMADQTDEAPEVLVIGLAAGTMARQVKGVLPRSRVTGVELDSAVVELGQRWFELPRDVRVVTDIDGRVALNLTDQAWDVVLVDAFSSQIYVPPTLATREAFKALSQSLRPGGWLALNLSAKGIEDPVAHRVLGTLRQVFPEVRCARVPGTRNLVAFARKEQSFPPSVDVLRAIRRAGLELPLGWMAEESRWFAPELLRPGEGLVDGRAPVEELAHLAWSGRWTTPASSASLEVSGVSSSDALDRAAAASRQTRWTEAQLWLSAATQLPSDLEARRGLLAGNIAFEQADWNAAEASYLSALASETVSEQIQVAAEENLKVVRVRGARKQELQGHASQLAGVLGVSLLGIMLLSMTLAKWAA